MIVRKLQVENLRLFEALELEPATGMNFLSGANGAGKTSLLEALHLLSSGRSFRGGARDILIRKGASDLRVLAHVEHADGRPSRIGLERAHRSWRALINGEPIDRLSDLFRELAVVCFEPGAHALVSGGAERRRQFMDWMLFHVEPSFFTAWRRYRRALKQRNSLLKQSAVDALLRPWEMQMVESGFQLAQQRELFWDGFRDKLKAVAQHFMPEAGDLEIETQSGWKGDFSENGLFEAISSSRARDQLLGYSQVGPHRADWSARFETLPSREMFSRGQEKLLVLACLLAQAEHFSHLREQWPVLLLDDLASELDAEHLEKALKWLLAKPVQCFITGTSWPDGQAEMKAEVRMFHVEHGRIALKV